jgi:F-type H+-transporting ATPase subunit b
MDALGITLPQLLTQLISFLILFFALYMLAYKPIMGMLDSRAEKIKDSLEAAETARLEAASSAEKVEAEIASARVEGQKIIADMSDAAKKVGEQIELKAREEAEAILAKNEAAIAQATTAAVEEIRKEFAGLAITAAEKIVEGSLDAKAHSDLIDKVLEEGLSGRNN